MNKTKTKSSTNHERCHLIEKNLLIYTKVSGKRESKTNIIHTKLGNTNQPTNSPSNDLILLREEGLKMTNVN